MYLTIYTDNCEHRGNIMKNEVYIKTAGKVIILLPMKNPWAPLIESLNQFSDDFMDNREQPDQQER